MDGRSTIMDTTDCLQVHAVSGPSAAMAAAAISMAAWTARRHQCFNPSRPRQRDSHLVFPPGTRDLGQRVLAHDHTVSPGSDIPRWLPARRVRDDFVGEQDRLAGVAGQAGIVWL